MTDKRQNGFYSFKFFVAIVTLAMALTAQAAAAIWWVAQADRQLEDLRTVPTRLSIIEEAIRGIRDDLRRMELTRR